jgi:hypothetical protein
MKKQKHKIRRNGKLHYPPHLLAVALLIALFFEGMIFGVATSNGKMPGVDVLDMTEDIIATKTAFTELFQPVFITVKGINIFYHLSAIEMNKLLEPNIIDHGARMIVNIDMFFRSASNEMAKILDLSEQIGLVPVAHAY